MLKRFWNKISATGIAHATTEGEIARTKLCNQFAMIMAITSVEYIFIFRFLGYPSQSNMVFFVIMAYLAPILFNYWGYLLFARFVAIFTVSAAITVFTSFFGTGSSIPHLCYALMAAPLLLYSLKNRSWLIATILVGMVPLFMSRFLFQKATLIIPSDVTITLSMCLKFTTATTLLTIIFHFARNINLQQKKQKALYTELMNADKYKSDFFANVSHELRTPMNAIIGFTDILMRRNPGPEEKDYLQTIKSSGENLLHIINDILDISKMESGKMLFEENPISIKELFSSLRNMMLPRAREKNLELIFEYPPDLPDVVLGDPTRLTQVIINLVGNALKFTEKGTVTTSVKVLKEEADRFIIQFSVTDTGVGIPEEKLKYIFERFRQAESYTTRHYGGTGLGLSIAKQLTELQGGSIGVESEISKGSTFRVVLPFKKYAIENARIASADKAIIDYEKMKKLRILLVEDNPINIKFVQSLFAEHNFGMDIARDGLQALEKLKTAAYDVVLMDLEMPNMTGYRATEIIRKEMKSNIPIIAMTANAMAGERERCLALGMNDYISKPISSELLFGKLHTISAEKYGEPEKTANREVRETPEKLVNLDFLIKSMGNKKAEIAEIIDIFCEQLPIDMEELSGAIKNTDYPNIHLYAHRMKSTLSFMGTEVMLAIAREIESLGKEEQQIEKISMLYASLSDYTKRVLKEAGEEKNNLMARS